MKARRRKGRCAVVIAPKVYSWPDPPMVPTVALRRVEQAETIEEVRAIVRQFLRPRDPDADNRGLVHIRPL